ncbi:MAG: rubrerythrin family protein [Thermotogota bacterium]
MSTTQKNLVKAFLIESKNQNLFAYFSSQAKKEGFIKIQKILEEISLHERSHSKNFLKMTDLDLIDLQLEYHNIPIKDTKTNIKNMINEIERIISLYDEFLETAKEEKLNKIFVKIKSIKIAHEYRLIELRKILSDMENNKFFKTEEKIAWKCMKCGYIHESKHPPETCPACEHPKGYFEKIDL